MPSEQGLWGLHLAASRTSAHPEPGAAISIRGAQLLSHPLMLCAIALLVLNDHWWKSAYSGVVTGKLSDFAGLCFFPVLLLLLWSSFPGGRRVGRGELAVCCSVTALIFALVQTTVIGGDCYRYGLGALQWPLRAAASWIAGNGIATLLPVVLTQDVGDLIALPASFASLWVGTGRAPFILTRG